MQERIFWGSIIGVTFYMLIPWLLTRVYGYGVFAKGRTPGHMALTFDDGPHPKYTPQLLDLLQRYQVKATFFVLGSKAEKYPDLIRRMHEEGHQVGIHNYTHKSNWLLAPWVIRTDHIAKTADIIHDIIGVRPTYYRPPWGIINFFDFYLRTKYRIILWSIMVSDWRSRHPGDVARMRNLLLRKCKGGSVVLLHDSGDTMGAIPEAPSFMLQALDEVLAKLIPQGMKCVRVDEMMKLEGKTIDKVPLLKRCIVWLYLKYDQLFQLVLRIKFVDKSDPFLKIRIRPYHGDRVLQLDDGETIRKGDRIIELHLNNEELYRLATTSRSTTQLSVHMIRGMQRLLPQISHLLQTDPTLRDVKGIYGISMIYRGTRMFGFTVLDMPRNIFTKITKLYLRVLMYIIHPQGKERLRTKSELLEPKIIAISRQELQKRFTA